MIVPISSLRLIGQRCPSYGKSLSQTSFYRKIRAYEATWSQSIHQTQFGFHRFRVLNGHDKSGAIEVTY